MGRNTKVSLIMTKENDKALHEYPFNSFNPFLNGVVQQITSGKTRKVAGYKWQQVLNDDAGELENQTMMVLAEYKEVDKREFTKLYRGSFKTFYGLPKSALDILDYIVENIKFSNDKICLVISDIKEQKKLSIATIYRSLPILIEKQLLAKADMQGCYFINPQIFFKGDTVTLVRQFKNKDAKPAPIKKLKQSDKLL